MFRPEELPEDDRFDLDRTCPELPPHIINLYARARRNGQRRSVANRSQPRAKRT